MQEEENKKEQDLEQTPEQPEVEIAENTEETEQTQEAEEPVAAEETEETEQTQEAEEPVAAEETEDTEETPCSGNVFSVLVSIAIALFILLMVAVAIYANSGAKPKTIAETDSVATPAEVTLVDDSMPMGDTPQAVEPATQPEEQPAAETKKQPAASVTAPADTAANQE